MDQGAMFRLSQAGKARRVALIEDSPLRRFDPRAKLALSLCASVMVMLPLEKLVVFSVVYVALLAWARMLLPAAAQVWKMKWLMLFLFLIDWWLVDLSLAVIITLRLAVLAGIFALFFSSTTVTEFRLALEQLRLPYRYAFSLSLAFQSLSLLDDEWRAILEAQQARGALPELGDWRQAIRQARNLVSLTVPAVVLATRRAWAVTEAAYARGFDSPRRVPYRRLEMKWRDWLLALGSVAAAAVFLWR
jgi:energy-coupling factor transport system permease protein